MPAIEEDYLDVLQNIESAIVSVYRQHPELLDAEVEKALNAVLLHYQAEKQQRAPHPAPLGARPELVSAGIQYLCEWRLGRAAPPASAGKQVLPPVSPLSLDEILACLKHVRKSVQKWNRQGGQRGYLQFVAQFIA